MTAHIIFFLLFWEGNSTFNNWITKKMHLKSSIYHTLSKTIRWIKHHTVYKRKVGWNPRVKGVGRDTDCQRLKDKNKRLWNGFPKWQKGEHRECEVTYSLTKTIPQSALSDHFLSSCTIAPDLSHHVSVQIWELPGLQSVRSEQTERRTLEIVRAGLQLSFKISRQITPCQKNNYDNISY